MKEWEKNHYGRSLDRAGYIRIDNLLSQKNDNIANVFKVYICQVVFCAKMQVASLDSFEVHIG